MTRPSTKAIADSNSQRLQAWLSKHYQLDDWADYLRDGALNRSLIASELAITRSSFYTNPAIKSLLDNLETRLRGSGKIPEAPPVTPEAKAASERDEKYTAELELRLKSVEERNATLVAENRELKRKLDRYQMIDDHLSQTGRLLPR